MLFQYIANMTKFRNNQSLSKSPQVERYVDDQFFAFTRGNVFVATSNLGTGRTLSRTITYHPYSDGTGEEVLHIFCMFAKCTCEMHVCEMQ